LHQAQRLENLGQLAGGIAHDFNNILAVIRNYSSFVSEELAAATDLDWFSHVESARKDVTQITLATDRAASLTRRLLSFARQEVIRPQVMDLNDVISGVDDMLRRTLGEHVELVTVLGDELWPILADPGQLEQVLVNLALNARDAMLGGGILTIDSDNITVDADDVAEGSKASLGRNVRLRVSDTGTGMPEQIVERAFEPFFTTKELGAGTGLGLATVYGIVVQAEGHIEINSSVGIGTTFTVTLPVTAEVALPEVPAVHKHSSPSGDTVLVVEDEGALREVTRRILSRNGYKVITAANGPEAIELVRSYSGEIDLLITDVIMPQMLGKEVAERLRALRPRINVLFMSGFARPALTSEGKLDRDVALLEKPFGEAELLALVEQVRLGAFPGFQAAASAQGAGKVAVEGK
jgi:nitrogen-specific signal transduction histidine kinase/CheY-like chemotaxis protein